MCLKSNLLEMRKESGKQYFRSCGSYADDGNNL
jgi:hypothetical protein